MGTHACESFVCEIMALASQVKDEVGHLDIIFRCRSVEHRIPGNNGDLDR